MKRAGSTRETLMLIVVAVVGLVLLAVFIPGRSRVMAPCELLPAQKWDLQEGVSGDWQSRYVDYRQGGALQVENYDLGEPTRITLTVPLQMPPAGSQTPAGIEVEEGQIIARISPASFDERELETTAGRLFQVVYDIATPIAGRLRLGGGAMCRVETIDDLVARIYVSQQEPMALLPGHRIQIEIDGMTGTREAEVLLPPPAPVPAQNGVDTGQWQFYAKLVNPEGLSPGLRGYALVGRPKESFPGVLWYRIKEQLQPRLQLPTR